ncbi:MAG: stress response translation initiation inhibitor YciH [Candidatus Lokiarchaeota archaeon]
MKFSISDKEICPLCSLPKELCVCSDLSADKQSISIFNSKRKWGKIVTLASFQGNFDADLSEILTKAKKKLGAGGTIRNNSIELRGDHRFRLKKVNTL